MNLVPSVGLLARVLSSIFLKRPNIRCRVRNLVSNFSSAHPPPYKQMVELKEEELLSDMRARVREQGDKVRLLKKENVSDLEVKQALAELKYRKKLLEEKELELMPPIPSFDRSKLEDLLKQKFFYDQSFAIYGGVQGLYDFGPMGCAMKANLLSAWRQHFILEDHLLEVDCAMLTPAPVLQASGHVERFADLMVKDVQTGECFRADHFVKGHLEAKLSNKKVSEAEKEEIRKILFQLDNLGSRELDDIIRRYDMKSITTNNEVSEPQEFNLMFATMIGPTGQCKGYLRPETAQGIFVNFRRLLQFNQGRIPFGAAQIGSAFRNEISPRSGLIRVREFTMAEIEYFVDPKHKEHPKFDEVRNVELSLYSACDQMDGRSPVKMTIGEAVSKHIVANETLGYFIARIHLFLLHVGVDRNRLRFRQHLSNEMAHYACDCWDAECLTSYGWIECVGCADRSCYDLMQHTKATGTRLAAEKRLSEPRTIQVCECIPNKQALGKAFRADSKSITEALAALTLDDALSFKEELSQAGHSSLNVNGKSFTITEPMVQIKQYEQTLHVEEVVPNVIEPSFGIGRILYTVFEHSFRVRDGDEQRTYLSVPPVLAPYKCSVLPLSNHPDFVPFIKQISNALTSLGVSHRLDESSGSIGRRYARTDQIAIPYGITIDFDTINKQPSSATLRERDSMKQIRVPLDELPTLVHRLSNCQFDWAEVQAKYPLFEQQETGLREEVEAAADEQQIQLAPSRKTNKQPKLKVGQKRKSPASPQQKRQNMNAQDKLDPFAHNDDWQSVSEDLGDHKDVYPDDIDNWSSATETTSAEPSVKPAIEKVTKENSTNKHEAMVSSTSIREYSTSPIVEKGFDSSQIEDRTNITWSNWGKAVRKHYEEEERREKTVATTPPRIEPRSPFSGYEADQEDNVMSKSGFAFDPCKTKDQDSLYDLSTAIDSCDDDSNNPTVVNNQTEPQLTNTDSDFPPLPVTSVPYHGLFVGQGWPNEKSKSLAQSHTKKAEKPKKVTKTDTVVVKPSAQPSSPEKPDEWTSVMARLLDNTCETDMWKLHVNKQEIEQSKIDQRTPIKDSHQPEKPQMYQLPTTNVSDNTEDIHHGLFAGPGWPSQSMKSKTIKSKSASYHSNVSGEAKKKQSDEEPSTENPNIGSWKSTLAQMYETSLVEDKWHGESQMNLDKLCHVVNQNEETSKVIELNDGSSLDVQRPTPTELQKDQLVPTEPIENKMESGLAPSTVENIISRLPQTNLSQPSVISTPIATEANKTDHTSPTSDDGNLLPTSSGQKSVLHNETNMTASMKRNKKRKSKRKK